MAHVTFTELLAQQVANASNVNSTLTSWNTQSTNIDADNIREEGLDSRSIAARAVIPLDGHGYYSDNTSTSFTNTSEALVSTGGDVICGPINLNEGDSEITIVRCSARLRIIGKGASPGAVQAGVTMRLKYTEDASPTSGSTWTTLTRTMRVFEFDDSQISGVNSPDEWATYTVCHRFDGPSSFSSSTLHFGLFAWISTSTGTYHLDRIHLNAVTYAR